MQSLVDATGGRILPVEVTAPSATGVQGFVGLLGMASAPSSRWRRPRPPSGGARAAQSAAHLQCRHWGLILAALEMG